jgi:hypothetical protein
MKPPVFPVLSADPGVRAVLTADGVTRVFPFGQAPENVRDPYCVWQLTGQPENLLGNQRPKVDSYSVQFDVYGTTAVSVESAGDAIQAAIEGHNLSTVSSYGGTTRDSETGRYRYSLTADWWVPRS